MWLHQFDIPMFIGFHRSAALYNRWCLVQVLACVVADAVWAGDVPEAWLMPALLGVLLCGPPSQHASCPSFCIHTADGCLQVEDFRAHMFSSAHGSARVGQYEVARSRCQEHDHRARFVFMWGLADGHVESQGHLVDRRRSRGAEG